MSLLEQLNSDMKQALKEKNKPKLSVIRMLKSTMQREQIELGRELNNDEELTVLSREMKQRKDSLQEFQNAERNDLADSTKKEMEILSSYMPKPLTDEELRQRIQEAISEVGAKSKADMGKVMGAIMPKVKGKAEGATVQKMVQGALSNDQK